MKPTKGVVPLPRWPLNTDHTTRGFCPGHQPTKCFKLGQCFNDQCGCLMGSRHTRPHCPEGRGAFVAGLLSLDSVVVEVHALIFIPQVPVNSLSSGLRSAVPGGRCLHLIGIHPMLGRTHVRRKAQSITEVCLNSACDVCLILVEQSIAINRRQICSPNNYLPGQQLPPFG